jgi:4-carboxymuconolactone decarboxylase
MQLQQRDKELAAIGAAIGCNCRPCVEHHIPAGRAAGHSETELADAVTVARAVRDEAIELLAPRIAELLGSTTVPAVPARVAEPSRSHALVSLGTSLGANSHQLLQRHIAVALEGALSAGELTAALKTAGYVQKRASEMTATAATHALDELAGVAAGPAPAT